MLMRRLARPLIGAAFVSSGIQGLREADERAVRARRLGLDNADLALRVSAGVQIGAGGLIAINRLPRLSALALAVTVLPEAMTAHTFWTETDKQARAAERELFVRDLGLLGALLIAAGDTAGRASLPRRAKHGAEHAAAAAAREARQARKTAAREARIAKETARRKLAQVA
jgi:putative oxidoreductase